MPKADLFCEEVDKLNPTDGRFYYGTNEWMDYNTKTLHTGIKVQIENVSEAAVRDVGIFNVCCTCGKVYWEGSHRRRVEETLKDVLQDGVAEGVNCPGHRASVYP